MLTKKIFIHGDLQIGESEGGFSPACILVGKEALDVVIARAMGESAADESRPHALEHGIAYAGHCLITVEPVIVLCPNCGSPKIKHDMEAHRLSDFCLDCLECGIFFREETADNARWLVAGDVEDRCTFISLQSHDELAKWESQLETVLSGFGGMYVNFHDNGMPAEVYFTESSAPHAADRLFTYQREIEPQKKDQYGDAIPDDLVVMPRHDWLDDTMRTHIFREVDWYECNDVLLVSAKAVDYASETDPADAGIDIVRESVNRIADSLKRYNRIDGFYHA